MLRMTEGHGASPDCADPWAGGAPPAHTGPSLTLRMTEGRATSPGFADPTAFLAGSVDLALTPQRCVLGFHDYSPWDQTHESVSESAQDSVVDLYTSGGLMRLRHDPVRTLESPLLVQLKSFGQTRCSSDALA